MISDTQSIVGGCVIVFAIAMLTIYHIFELRYTAKMHEATLRWQPTQNTDEEAES